jgi:hypothetical protein
MSAYYEDYNTEDYEDSFIQCVPNSSYMKQVSTSSILPARDNPIETLTTLKVSQLLSK